MGQDDGGRLFHCRGAAQSFRQGEEGPATGGVVGDTLQGVQRGAIGAFPADAGGIAGGKAAVVERGVQRGRRIRIFPGSAAAWASGRSGGGRTPRVGSRDDAGRRRAPRGGRGGSLPAAARAVRARDSGRPAARPARRPAPREVQRATPAPAAAISSSTSPETSRFTGVPAANSPRSAGPSVVEATRVKSSRCGSTGKKYSRARMEEVEGRLEVAAGRFRVAADGLLGGGDQVRLVSPARPGGSCSGAFA